MSVYGSGVAVVADNPKAIYGLTGGLLETTASSNDSTSTLMGVVYGTASYFLTIAGLSYVDSTGAHTITLPAAYNNIKCFDVRTRDSDGVLILAIGREADVTNDAAVAFFDIDDPASPTLETALKGKTDMGSPATADGDCEMRAIALSPNADSCVVGGTDFMDTISWNSGTSAWVADASGTESGALCTGACWISTTYWAVMISQNGNWAGATSSQAYIFKSDGAGTDSHVLLGTGESDAVGYPHNIDTINITASHRIAAQYAWGSFCVVDGNSLAVSNNQSKANDVRCLVWDGSLSYDHLCYIEDTYDTVRGYTLDTGAWVEADTQIPAKQWVVFAGGSVETLTITPDPNVTYETDFTAYAFDTSRNGKVVAIGHTKSNSAITLPIPEYAQYAPLLVTLQQGASNTRAKRWESGVAVALNDRMIATDYKNMLYLFKCTTAGDTDIDEPTWNTATGSITNDDTVVWTCLGKMLKPVSNYPEYAATEVFGGGGGELE